MQLDILFYTPTLDGMQKRLNVYFNQFMKLHQEKVSMFEQYHVRPKERFIPEIWKYRVVCNSGVYYFGKLG